MKKLFNRPYPLFNEPKRRWWTAAGMGLFVFLFLLIFHPFGLQNLPIEEAPFYLLGYGLVTFLMLTINFFVLPMVLSGIFDEEKWTVLKEILFLIWIIFSIGLANAVYTLTVIGRASLTALSFEMIARFEIFTLLVSVLPVTILILLKQNKMLNDNIKKANEITGQLNYKKRLESIRDTVIVLESNNNNEKLAVIITDLIAIKAADNYIEVYYLHEGTLKTKLLRTTIKAVRDSLRMYTAFYRCHRSWIVNLDRVERLTGNSQGFRIMLLDDTLAIPVSRNLNKELIIRIAK